MKVNFFLIGPPRCASTSLAKYLSMHPDVCFGNPKEPTYFCTDTPAGYKNEPKTIEEYHSAYFSHYRPQEHKLVGEATPLYLMSECAVPSILEYNPEAKFIALARNPIDIVTSMHAARVRVGLRHENIPDFEEAWNAQEDRKRGDRLPKKVIRGAVLQYRKLGSLGTQFDRLIKQVPPDNLHVIVYDDLLKDMEKTQKMLLRFLGLSELAGTSVPHLERNSEWRNEIARRFFEFAKENAHRFPIRPKIGLLNAIRRFGVKPANRKEIRPEFRAQLREEFAGEISLLSKLLNRDFSHWQ
jgi:hypothetical protein